MAQAEFHEVLNVDRDKMFEAVTRYEDYPKFVDGCKSVKVDRKGPNKAHVTYQVNVMKEVSYTLEHTEDREAGRMSWKLIDGDVMKTNSGFWELEEAGPGKTDVRYNVEIDFKIPVPGFVLNRLVKSNLPSMVKGFADHARKR